jgi:SpoIIAA-like
MFQLLDAPQDTVLALRFSGEISAKETERLVRIVQAHAARHGKARLFLLMDHYASFNSAESLYEDLRFAVRCKDLIAAMAVVGDRPWKSTWVGLFGLFGALETAYFDRTETQEAWQWLTGQPAPHQAWEVSGRRP